MTIIPDDGPPLALLPEQQFTLKETARLLCVAEITVRRFVARKKLRAIGSGRLLRFALCDIRDFQDRERQ